MGQWVTDDREQGRFLVNRAAMTSPDVLALERERIFNHCWLYVGHASEIPNSHDFRARDVGGRPLILTRGTDGAIRVFYNTCTHRGTLLCREKEGHGKYFKCFYHSWAFDTSGRLAALPDDEAYGPSFDRSLYALGSPAQVDHYRDFIFVNYDPDAPDLVTYLAGAAPYLDLIADQNETGMEVLRGAHEYSMRANWKLLVENSMDAYHAMSVHQRYFQMVLSAGMSIGEMPLTRGAELGNGHAVAETLGGNTRLGRPYPTERAAQKDVNRREALRRRFGDGWADRMNGTRNLLIFPNLAVVDLVGAIAIRKMDPITPDYMEITAWELAPVDEDPELRDGRLDSFLTFWGPGGLGTPDDVEALECCQQGFRSLPDVGWSDISRGMSRDTCTWSDELQMRSFWRSWNNRMTSEYLPPEPQVVPEAVAASRPSHIETIGSAVAP